jgi:Tol biopolymer transport system component
VCRIFDLGHHEMPARDGHPRPPVTFLTMELLTGETLAHHLSHQGRYSTAEAFPLVLQMGSALAAAHRAGVVHRDFKSGNVMLVPAGEGEPPRVVVTDFGLAWSTTEASPAVTTASGFVLGTPAYIAPEQVEGEKATAAVDQYALGVVMFEMITGHTPFTGETPLAVVVKRLKDVAPSPRTFVPDLDPLWEQAIARCLERDPAARFMNVEDLLSFLNGEGTHSAAHRLPSGVRPALPRVSPKPPVTPPSKRRWPLIAALAAGLLVLATLGVLAWRRPAAAPPQTAVPAHTSAQQLTTSSGLDLHPSFSPDGRMLAYSSNRSGTFELRLAPVGGTGADTALTSDGKQNVQPAFSPDGSLIAYHSKGAGGIWVIPPQGGTPRRLTTFGSRPAWSPSGKSIAFQSNALIDFAPNAVGAMPPSTLWVVGLDGKPPRALTTGGSPAGGHGAPTWSRDEKRIVFTASDRRWSMVWSIALDGSELFRMVADQVYAYDPVYSPDGRRLYYSAVSESGNFGVWALPLRDDGRAAGAPARVADLGLGASRHLAISADGRRIAFSALQMISNLRQVSATPGGAALPPLTRETGRNSRPSFSPDGAWLAFERWRQGQNSDLWLMRPDGTEVAPVTTDPAIDTVPAWFPDGKTLVYRSDRLGRPTLWRFDLATRKESLLLEPSRDMDWVRLSPDGKTIAFISTSGSGAMNVWLSSLDGEEARQLTYDSEFMGFPCWAPDGKSLAVQIKRGENAQVALVSPDGGSPVVLTQGEGQAWPYSFSPDGRSVAFAGLRGGLWNVYAVSVDTKEERRLTDLDQINAYVRYPAWSPRGNRVVYEYAETSGNVWMVELSQ